MYNQASSSVIECLLFLRANHLRRAVCSKTA
jgi:hypothetical protein